MLFPSLFFLLLGCFAAWLAINWLLSAGVGQSGGGEPQHHHTHTGVIPRIGGAGLMAGFTLIYWSAYWILDRDGVDSVLHFGLFGGALAAFTLGFVDDFRPLGAKVKLLLQILIGVGAYQCGLSIEKITLPLTDVPLDLGHLSLALTIFWFVAMMNLINLIDGLDGLAGGIGLMLMALLAFLAFNNNAHFSAIVAIGMVGAILGFLFHNFPPAKVYMGDSGAYLIGFTIAALSLLNSQKGTVVAALVAPVLALALPIADVSFAMLRRALHGLPLFRPDRNHIHHKLIRSGLSRRNTVLVLYGISLFALVVALLAFSTRGYYLPIFLGFAFVVVLFALRGQKISARSLRGALNDSLQARQDTRNALYLRDWLIVEAERADTGKNLWSDFRFVLKKMGFCRAEVHIGEEMRSFYVPHTAHETPEILWTEVHTIGGGMPMKLVLYAEKDNLSQRQFSLISDIAAETLGKTALRWKEINGAPLTFHSIAASPNSYRTQKARSLYRPTY